MNVHVVTVATDPKGWFEALVYTAKHFGYKLTVLGMGEKWQGWQWRIQLIMDFISRLPTTDYVMHVDAYDVIFLRPACMLDLTLVGENLLVGAIHPHPSEFIRNQVTAKRFFSKEPNKAQLCAGTWIGTVQVAVNIFNHAIIEDDQEYLNQILNINPSFLKLDDTSKIFATLVPNITNNFLPKNHDNITFDNQVLKHGITNSYPFVLHFISEGNMEFILEGIGLYNFKKITDRKYNINKKLYHVQQLLKNTKSIQIFIFLFFILIIFGILIFNKKYF